MSKDKNAAGEEITAALDDYLLKALEELWAVVKDPKHPEHKRHYFESLKLILRHTAPIRKEYQPPPPPPEVIPQNDISVQIENLFHSNSIEQKKDVLLENYTIEETDEDTEKS